MKPLNILHLTTHVNLGGITSSLGTLSKAMAKRGHRSAVVSAGGSATAMLTRAGVSCYEFDIRTKSELNPKLWLALWRVVRLVKEENYDLIHAHTRVTQVLAYFISKITGVPYLSTAHGFYTPRIGRRLFPAWGSCVIAISSLVAEELEGAHRLPREKIRLIHNAIDLEAFKRQLLMRDRESMRMRYGIPKNAFVVGSVSRLVRDKGHDLMLDAVKGLLAEIPDIFALIVGDGRERRRLEDRIRAEIPANGKLIPGVQDTTAVLSMMDIFVHPATHREGFGLSIAEAMTAKLPIIATDIPAINTLLKDGQNGRVVEPNSASELQKAIRDLRGDPAASRRLAEKGYETAVSLCRPERLAEETEQVYMEILKK